MRYIKSYNKVSLYKFKISDAQDIEDLIKKCVLFNYRNVFSDNMIQLYLDYYISSKIIERSNSYHIIVAKIENKVVGTGSLDDTNFITGLSMRNRHHEISHIYPQIIKKWA